MLAFFRPGKHQKAHYAFATVIMNLGFMLLSMFIGMLSDWLGYETFFIIVLVATIPAFLVTVFVSFVYPNHKDVVAQME